MRNRERERTDEAKTKVTMNDIARAAGVSQATVSLVLNQSRNIKLSDDTRQRVINVATELGYDRLPAVHAPRNQEEIALLVSSLQSFDPFIDAISQAREAAWRNETLLTVYDYGDDVKLALNIICQLDKRNCIGIILASPVTNVVDMTAFQDCTRIPLVLLNQRDPGSPLLPSFIPDDYAIYPPPPPPPPESCGSSEPAGLPSQPGRPPAAGLPPHPIELKSSSSHGPPRLAGDRLPSGAGGERRAHPAGHAAGGLRRPEDFRAAHPPLTSIQLPYSELGTAGGGVPAQSGRCRHARDAGGQAEGARPSLV